MAITGKLLADFTSFYDAVNKAEVSLGELDSSALTVSRQLNRMTESFSGKAIIQEALLATEAIEEIGGASKLTESEQAALNRTIDQAIEKYKALGQEAPPAMIALQAETTRTKGKIDEFGAGIGAADRALAQVGVNLGPLPAAIGELGAAAGKTATQIGLIGTTALTAAAAVGGWSIGRWISNLGDLDTKIGNVTAKLLGWGDVAAVEAAEGARTLADASLIAGRQITDLNEAVLIINQSTKNYTADAKAAVDADKEREEAAKKLAEEQRKLTESLFSRDDIKRAEDYMTALGGIENVTRLTVDKKKELKTVVDAALAAYTALGEKAPRQLQLVSAATTELIGFTRSFSDTHSGAWVQFATSIEDGKAKMAEIAEASKLHWRDLGGVTREELQTIAKEAREKYELAMAHSDHFTSKQIADFKRAADEAQAAADRWGTYTFDTYDQVATKATETADHQIREADRVADQSARLGAASTPMGGATFTLPNVNPVTGEGMAGTDPRVQGYLRAGYTLGEAITLAQGVPNTIMRPQGYWTAKGYHWGSPITAEDFGSTGALGAPAVTTNVTVNGSVLGTQQELARAVGDAVMASLRSQGVKLGTGG